MCQMVFLWDWVSTKQQECDVPASLDWANAEHVFSVYARSSVGLCGESSVQQQHVSKLPTKASLMSPLLSSKGQCHWEADNCVFIFYVDEPCFPFHGGPITIMKNMGRGKCTLEIKWAQQTAPNRLNLGNDGTTFSAENLSMFHTGVSSLIHSVAVGFHFKQERTHLMNFLNTEGNYI